MSDVVVVDVSLFPSTAVIDGLDVCTSEGSLTSFDDDDDDSGGGGGALDNNKRE